jgi:hypothetical protein
MLRHFRALLCGEVSDILIAPAATQSLVTPLKADLYTRILRLAVAKAKSSSPPGGSPCTSTIGSPFLQREFAGRESEPLRRHFDTARGGLRIGIGDEALLGKKKCRNEVTVN